MPISKTSAKKRGLQGHLGRLIRQGDMEAARKYATVHNLTHKDLPHGGEGVPSSGPLGDSDTFTRISNFSQLELERVQEMVNARRAALGSAQPATRAACGSASAAAAGQSGGVGGLGETVKILNEYQTKDISKHTLTKKKEVDVKGVPYSPAEHSETVLDREIRERKERAMQNPWPEECEVRVCGNGGKWQMRVELEDGRQTYCWKGGYNLYVQERLKVKVEERLGEDVIYGVVERLGDKSIEPEINRAGVVEKFNALVSSKPVPTLAAKDSDSEAQKTEVGSEVAVVAEIPATTKETPSVTIPDVPPNPPSLTVP